MRLAIIALTAIVLLFVSCALAESVVLQEITSTTTIISAKILSVTWFSASPTNAEQGQTVDFTLRFENSGNQQIDANATLTVTTQSGSTVFQKNFSTTTLPSGSTWLIQTEWDTLSNAIGEYNATVQAWYNGTTTNSSTTLAIYQAPQGGSTGGGTSGGTSTRGQTVSQELRGEKPLGAFYGKPRPDLQTAALPVRVDVLPNTQETSWFVFSNNGSKPTDMRVEVQGVPGDWVKVERAFQIPSQGFHTTSVNITPPADASARDYIARMIVMADGETLFENFFNVRVKPAADGEKPTVLREISINPQEKTTHVEIQTINANSHAKTLTVRERVPKSLAEKASDINFVTQPTRIVEADPVVEWQFKNVKPAETRNASYTVNKIVADYDTYLYWTTEQVWMSVEKPLEGAGEVQITDVFVPSFKAGADNELRVSVANFAPENKSAFVTFRLPSGWIANSMSLSLPPMTIENLAFNISVPASTKAGSYLIQIFVDYDEKLFSKDITVIIAPETAWPLKPEELLLLLVVGGGVAAAAYVTYSLRKIGKPPTRIPQQGRKAKA